MGATVKHLVGQIIAQAKNAPPAAQAEILRGGAYTFMGLAHDPRNVKAQQQLAKIGLGFAGAAMRAQSATMDDFVDLLQETRAAYEQTDNAMDEISLRRQIHDERTPPDPGHISIAPSSFNKDATLGRSAVIKFAPTNDDIAKGIVQQQNVAFWQGVKKEAQAMTVDASLGFLPAFPFQGENPPTINNRPYVEVEYGSDGNRTKIKFDLALGNRCTAVGNYLAVTIGMDPPRLESDTTELTVGASIGAFSAPSQSPLICSAYIDDLVGLTGSNPIPIPLKAVQLLPMQSNAALAETSSIEFLDYGGALMYQVFYQQSGTSAMQPIPIAGDVSFVRVNNPSAFVRNYRLPFQLGL